MRFMRAGVIVLEDFCCPRSCFTETIFSIKHNADSHETVVRNYLNHTSMKRKYLFVRKVNQFGYDDVVYHVWVGSSQRELTLLALVQCYCKDCGLFFHQWNDTTAKSVQNLANGLFPGTSASIFLLKRADITIWELYQMILDDSFTAYEKSLARPKGWAKIIQLFDPSIFRYQNVSKCNTLCLPLIRKYLSDGMEDSLFKAAIAFCLILALFLTSGFLEGIERSLY